MGGQLERVLQPELRDREGAPRHAHRRRPRGALARAPLEEPKVAHEEVRVERRRHEDQAEVGPAAEEVAKDHEEEIALHRALVDLVDDDVRHAAQLRVLLQPPRQDARRAEEERRRRRRRRLQRTE